MNIKHLSTGVALTAALTVSAPVWAQTQGGNSYGGNSMGIAGPNPGGPETPGTINGGLFGHTPSPSPASTSATADQLNREELSGLQSGSSIPPEGPPGTMPTWDSRSGGNSMDVPGPNPGGPGLTPYNR
jgi:hypothetical protein